MGAVGEGELSREGTQGGRGKEEEGRERSKEDVWKGELGEEGVERRGGEGWR